MPRRESITVPVSDLEATVSYYRTRHRARTVYVDAGLVVLEIGQVRIALVERCSTWTPRLEAAAAGEGPLAE